MEEQRALRRHHGLARRAATRQRRRLGERTGSVVICRRDLPLRLGHSRGEGHHDDAVRREDLQYLRALHDVVAATVTNGRPLTHDGGFTELSRTPGSSGAQVRTSVLPFDEQGLRTLGIPLLAGRDFRNMAVFLTAVTSLMLAVCCLGLFGLTAFNVNSRIKQIGVRRAVGARRRDIVLHFRWPRARSFPARAPWPAACSRSRLGQWLSDHYGEPRLRSRVRPGKRRDGVGDRAARRLAAGPEGGIRAAVGGDAHRMTKAATHRGRERPGAKIWRHASPRHSHLAQIAAHRAGRGPAERAGTTVANQGAYYARNRALASSQSRSFCSARTRTVIRMPISDVDLLVIMPFDPEQGRKSLEIRQIPPAPPCRPLLPVDEQGLRTQRTARGGRDFRPERSSPRPRLAQPAPSPKIVVTQAPARVLFPL